MSYHWREALYIVWGKQNISPNGPLPRQPKNNIIGKKTYIFDGFCFADASLFSRKVKSFLSFGIWQCKIRFLEGSFLTNVTGGAGPMRTQAMMLLNGEEIDYGKLTLIRLRYGHFTSRIRENSSRESETY
jgi:hypothetical protein